jgi:hypothetical protein
VRQEAGITGVGGVIVIVIGGDRGSGFACQTDGETLLALPDILQDVVNQMQNE